MAREFTKNLSNFVDLGAATIGPLLNGATGITFACWVNPASFAGTNIAGDDLITIYQGTLQGVGFIMGLSNANTGVGDPFVGVRRVGTDAGHSFNSSTLVSTSQWSHVVGCVTFGQAAKIWINGAQASGSVAGLSTTTAGTFLHTAGTRRDSLACFLHTTNIPLSEDRQFNGQMAECGLWNVELSSAEIQSLYKGFAPPQVKPQNLTCYWPMIGRGTVIEELRNGKNGTIAGSIPNADHPRIYA